ncbi:MAG: hypothetical protein ACI4MA_09550 [Treponema sp.]
MKKIIGVLVALGVMAGSAFARGAYDGDIQLHLGVGFDSYSMVKPPVTYEDGTLTYSSELSTATFDFDLETWHLFNFNDVFGLGFMAGFNGGIGGATKVVATLTHSKEGSLTTQLPNEYLGFAARFYGLIGPAVGIKLGNVVKFDIALGLAYGFSTASFYQPEEKDSLSMIFMGGAGFGFDIQAKFVPNSPVSPVIGYRFAVIPVTSYTAISEAYGTQEIKCDSASNVNNEIYIGISFNW